MDARYFVYVILNDQGRAYTGISTDIDRRVAQHNAGAGAKNTRGQGPWVIIHSEGPMSKSDAAKREAAIKKDRTFKAQLKQQTQA
jgi:putative endonuclease